MPQSLNLLDSLSVIVSLLAPCVVCCIGVELCFLRCLRVSAGLSATHSRLFFLFVLCPSMVAASESQTQIFQTWMIACSLSIFSNHLAGFLCGSLQLPWTGKPSKIPWTVYIEKTNDYWALSWWTGAKVGSMQYQWSEKETCLRKKRQNQWQNDFWVFTSSLLLGTGKHINNAVSPTQIYGVNHGMGWSKKHMSVCFREATPEFDGWILITLI